MAQNNRFAMHLNKTDWFYIHLLQNKFKERYQMDLRTVDVIKLGLEVAAGMDDDFFDDMVCVPAAVSE